MRISAPHIHMTRKKTEQNAAQQGRSNASASASQRITVIGGAGTLIAPLLQIGHQCDSVADPAEFLNGLVTHNCDLIVIGPAVRHDQAIEVLGEIKTQRPELPVIVVASRGDIASAVKAIKLGAIDFVENDGPDSSHIIRRISAHLEIARRTEGKMPSNLTPMERRVLKCILLGLSNTQTAGRLELSVRTVEDHRRNVMRKFDAETIVDLVRMCAAKGIIPGRPAKEQTPQFDSSGTKPA